MDRLANSYKLAAANMDRGLAQTKLGTIASYDPNSHAVRVTVQPEGVLTGWIALGALAAGAGLGVIVGPTIGDQVVLEPVEGSAEQWVVTHRLFSTVDPPPTSSATGKPVQSGEVGIFSSNGAFFHLTQTGDHFMTVAHSSSTTAPANVNLDTPGVNTTGNGVIGTGASGTIVDASGKVATFRDGICVNIF